MRYAVPVVALGLVASCQFQPKGIGSPDELPGARPDLAMAGGGDEDMASGADIGAGHPPDPEDMAGTQPGDLASPIVGFPSHVAFHDLDDSALDWAPADGTIIDTKALTVSPATAGLALHVENGLAVLPLHSLSIGSGVKVQVAGDRPLVIVAGATISVAGVLDAGAHGAAPGPGAPAGGDGAGGDGNSSAAGGSGAGGGSFGGAGMSGGGVAVAAGATAPPIGAAGATWGDAKLTALVGGASGGTGNGATGTLHDCVTPATGGGGGGALQLSARVRITIGGLVTVGGGGGRGGCAGTTVSGSGGGGGAGGALLVEAPTVDGAGLASAGGGGGGGGGCKSCQGSPNGGDGFDAADATSPSRGGKPGQNSGVNGGGAGAGVATPTAGGTTTAMSAGGGGGGGGYGRIYVRVSGAAPLQPVQQPAALVDGSLPAQIP